MFAGLTAKNILLCVTSHLLIWNEQMLFVGVAQLTILALQQTDLSIKYFLCPYDNPICQANNIFVHATNEIIYFYINKSHISV